VTRAWSAPRRWCGEAPRDGSKNVTGALLIAFIAGTGAASASTIDNQFLTATDAEGIVFDTGHRRRDAG
jgi:hypothetical protein